MASSLTQPTLITTPFANSGSKRTIPIPSQIGVTDGQASFTDGFPPLNATPLTSGGVPPSVLDMNGALFTITENLRFLLGGGAPKFDATMAASVGGYPVGACLIDDAGQNIYINVLDGNSTNFNTTPASIGVSWKLVYGLSVSSARSQRFTSNGTFTVPKGVTSILVSGCAGGGGGGAGGGGGSNYYGAGGGGGGAGQSIVRQAYTVTPGQTIPITIGGAGAGGAGTTSMGTGGSNGGPTVVGSLVTLLGGGVGGHGSNAISAIAGGNYGTGYPNGSYGSDTTANNASGNGGDGAGCPFGGGGGSGRGASSQNAPAGHPAVGFGGGGGGGGGVYSYSSVHAGGNGGAGAPGIVIIEW